MLNLSRQICRASQWALKAPHLFSLSCPRCDGSKALVKLRLPVPNTYTRTGPCLRPFSTAETTDSLDASDGHSNPFITTESSPVQHSAFDSPTELFASIHQAASDDVNTVLELVHLHKDAMFEEHVLECLHKLFVYACSNSTVKNHLVTSLREDRRFLELCVVLIQLGPRFSPAQIVSTVFKMKRLGLDSKSVPLQVFLELGKHVVNDLKLVDVINMADSIWDMEETSQVIVLKEALRALALARFDETQNLIKVDSLIKYVNCFGEHLSQMQAASLMFCLEDEMHDLSYHYSLRLLSCAHKLLIQTAPVINHCMLKVEKRAAKKPLCKDDVLTVLRAYGNLKIKNLDLLKTLLQFIVMSDEYTVVDLLEVSRLLTRCQYSCSQVLDLLADKLVDPSYDVSAMDVHELCQVIHNFGYMDYSSDVIDQLLGSLTNVLCKSSEALNLSSLIQCLLDLAVLNNFPEKLLQNILTHETLDKISEPTLLDDWLLLREVTYQRSNMADSLEPLNKVPAEVMFPWHFNRLQKCIVPSAPSLDHVVINVFTDQGLHIEYLLGLDVDGCYAAIHQSPYTELKEMKDSEPVKMSELNLPEHLQRVAVVSFPRSGVIQNTRKLSGRNRLYIETLQHLGYLTIPINRDHFFSLSEKERLKYIKRRLKAPWSYQELQWFGVGGF